MSQILSQLFVDSFVRGVGKTSGTLITMFVGWQLFKVTNGHDDFLSFLLGKRPEKTIRDSELSPDVAHEVDHEEINLEDIQEHKFKSLFDKL
jgi:hypothetical protein